MQRFLIRLAIVFATSILGAQSPAFVIGNAAGYGAAAAPDSLATIFGTGLAQATASAALDAAGQLPTELAGTGVEISGVAAQLFYVSPTQINLVIPGGIDPGTVDVVIKSTASGASKVASAFLRLAAPGVFTTDASGTGPGAILNAVTYARAPFLVQTGPGGDTRTRLAIYGTGFRHAQTVSAVAQDSAGNRYNLTVEYAGLAPGFVGLDQVNVLLPPDLDGAGTVSLALGADGNPANPVTFQMNLLAASVLQLSSLSVTPAFVSAGESAVLTVGLNGVARAGGYAVALHSTGAAAQVAAQITIPEGKAFAQTAVNTLTVPTQITPTISAQAGGLLLNTSLEIDPANTVQLANLSVTPASIPGGRSPMGTVTLTGIAPAAGAKILVSADSDKVSVAGGVVGGVVLVPFGKSSADFTISTLAVTQLQPVTLTATLSRISVTAKLTLLPPLQLSLDANSVVAGNSVIGTLTLGESAPITGAVIALQSSDGVVRPPYSVTVPSGQTSQTFTISTTSPLTASRVATITATYLGFKQTASLTVTPLVAPTLSSVTVSPNPVTGGNSAQGTATLTTAATVSTTVTLFSNSAIAFVPASVTVPQGQTSMSFSVTTVKGLTGNATITASLPGVSKSVTLSVR